MKLRKIATVAFASLVALSTLGGLLPAAASGAACPAFARWSCSSRSTAFSIMLMFASQPILASRSQTVIAPNKPTRAPIPPRKTIRSRR